jgi:hypothetical protein
MSAGERKVYRVPLHLYLPRVIAAYVLFALLFGAAAAFIVAIVARPAFAAGFAIGAVCVIALFVVRRLARTQSYHLLVESVACHFGVH